MGLHTVAAGFNRHLDPIAGIAFTGVGPVSVISHDWNILFQQVWIVAKTTCRNNHIFSMDQKVFPILLKPGANYLPSFCAGVLTRISTPTSSSLRFIVATKSGPPKE